MTTHKNEQDRLRELRPLSNLQLRRETNYGGRPFPKIAWAPDPELSKSCFNVLKILAAEVSSTGIALPCNAER